MTIIDNITDNNHNNNIYYFKIIVSGHLSRIVDNQSLYHDPRDCTCTNPLYSYHNTGDNRGVHVSDVECAWHCVSFAKFLRPHI